MTKQFTRTQENFTCEYCGKVVEGNGYTNHCTDCLWTKHVDIKPGDRKELCKGLMKPIGIRNKNGDINIVHRCIECKKQTNVKSDKNDNKEKIIELSTHVVKG